MGMHFHGIPHRGCIGKNTLQAAEGVKVESKWAGKLKVHHIYITMARLSGGRHSRGQHLTSGQWLIHV